MVCKCFIVLIRPAADTTDADIKSGLRPVIICRPPPPGAEAVRGRQAYYSLDDKLPVIRMDGRPRIAEDHRLPARAAPTRARVPDKKNIIRISSSPPPAKVQSAPHSSDDSSVVIASSPQPSARVPKKRKAHVDSSSLLSDDDNDYIADPKPKRSKASQKAVVATGQQKREVGIKRKGKEVAGKGKEKEKEKPAKARQVKKTVKSVAFINDEDDSSSDNKPPPATRPTPKPAYHGAKSLQASLPESERAQKDMVSTLADKHAAQPSTVSAAQPRTASSPISIPPAIPTDSSHDGHAKQSIKTTTVTVTPAGEASHPTATAPAIPTHGVAPSGSEGQYLPRGPRPPLHGYPADEHDRYYHARPPVRRMDDHPYGIQPPMPYQNPGRYPGDGEVLPERYGFRGDYYGYSPGEYYAPPYPHRAQSPYVARPPAPYHRHALHEPHPRPETSTSPRGPTDNAMASSSRLSPSDPYAKPV